MLLLCLLALLGALAFWVGTVLFVTLTKQEVLTHLKSRLFQHYYESKLWITLFMIGPYFLWIWITINTYEQPDIPHTLQILGVSSLLVYILLSLTIFPVWLILRGNPVRRLGFRRRTLKRLNR